MSHWFWRCASTFIRNNMYCVQILVGVKYWIDWIDRHITIRANHITSIPTINRMTIWLCAFGISDGFISKRFWLTSSLLSSFEDTICFGNRSWRKWEFCAIFGFARAFVSFTNEDNENITLMDAETRSFFDDVFFWLRKEFPFVRCCDWRRLRLASFYHEIIPFYPNSKQ